MKNLIYFGLAVSEYWLPTLDKGFEKISKIVKDENISDFRIVQVKEKFGGLRIYTRGSTYSNEIEKIIDDLEIEVETICQKCISTIVAVFCLTMKIVVDNKNKENIRRMIFPRKERPKVNSS